MNPLSHHRTCTDTDDDTDDNTDDDNDDDNDDDKEKLYVDVHLGKSRDCRTAYQHRR